MIYSADYSIESKTATTVGRVVVLTDFLPDPSTWFSRNQLDKSKIELGFRGTVTFSLVSTSNVGSKWTYIFELTNLETII